MICACAQHYFVKNKTAHSSQAQNNENGESTTRGSEGDGKQRNQQTEQQNRT